MISQFSAQLDQHIQETNEKQTTELEKQRTELQVELEKQRTEFQEMLSNQLSIFQLSQQNQTQEFQAVLSSQQAMIQQQQEMLQQLLGLQQVQQLDGSLQQPSNPQQNRQKPNQGQKPKQTQPGPNPNSGAGNKKSTGSNKNVNVCPGQTAHGSQAPGPAGGPPGRSLAAHTFTEQAAQTGTSYANATSQGKGGAVPPPLCASMSKPRSGTVPSTQTVPTQSPQQSHPKSNADGGKLQWQKAKVDTVREKKNAAKKLKNKRVVVEGLQRKVTEVSIHVNVANLDVDADFLEKYALEHFKIENGKVQVTQISPKGYVLQYDTRSVHAYKDKIPRGMRVSEYKRKPIPLAEKYPTVRLHVSAIGEDITEDQVKEEICNSFIDVDFEGSSLTFLEKTKDNFGRYSFSWRAFAEIKSSRKGHLPTNKWKPCFPISPWKSWIPTPLDKQRQTPAVLNAEELKKRQNARDISIKNASGIINI